MSKKLDKPEEIEDDVSLGDILSGADVSGIASTKASGDGIRGRKTAFGMIGTRIIESAVVIAEKRRAIDLLKKGAKLNAKQKEIAEKTWIAVVSENDLKRAATLQAKELKDRLKNTEMSDEEWRNQSVTVRGKKVPVGVYSRKKDGGQISAPSPARASGYGNIYESKLRVIKENYGVPLGENDIEGVALIELSGMFE